MRTLGNYRLLEEIYASGHTRVLRAVQVVDQRPVILKVLGGEAGTANGFVQFQHEFEVTRALADVPGVIQVLALEAVQDSLMIVQEDIGGESLASLLGHGPIGLGEALELAIRITQVLGRIHRAGVIHKDFTAANIVWNRRSGELRVIDFGISTSLSQERLDFQNVNQLEGNLAYAAPEQTGRINRRVDSRTDLYSLGVTLYQLFTGTLPFRARTGIELVHAHLAQKPVAPQSLDPAIPPMLSALILHLMAKMAEDRYQSAYGVEQDLIRCRDALQAGGSVPSFTLAEKDVPTRLLIPQKLVGREGEVARILSAFERCAAGATELLLVSGFSGTGKSALVHEVHRPLTERRGNFIAGKFDQYQRDVPFYAWRKAFEEFCNLLLTEDEATLAQWRERIRTGLGEIGKVVAEIVPAIELIVGTLPEVPRLAGEQALNRLNYVFGNFLKAICSAQHPLVLFIDDWQWADAGSLALLRAVMGDKEIRHLLVLGAYRDNEVDPTHPLMRTLDDIRGAGAVSLRIELAPLQAEHVRELVRDTLDHAPGFEQLAQLVFEKTGGNAFFVVQLLTDLYDKGVLRYSTEQGHWVWSPDEVASRKVADNVVDLMAAKIGRLPQAAQRVLVHASCIGDRFALSTLASTLGQPAHEVAAQLQPALLEGILMPLGVNYRLAQLQANTAAIQYQFVHDRVRQAAYGALDPAAAEQIHHGIALRLLAEADAEAQDAQIFDIANQFNAARRVIREPVQRNQLFLINLRAGRRAKAATAYTTARNYLNVALELLPLDAWGNWPEQCAELQLLLAEVAFLTKDFGAMEQALDDYLAHRSAALEQVAAHKIRVQARVVQNRLSEAVDIGLQALALVGVRFPRSPEQAEVGEQLMATIALLKDRPIEGLLDLPAMTDAEQLAAMDLLGLILPPAYWTSQELLALTVFRMVQLTVQHGHSPNAGYGFSWWGITECALLGNIEAGVAFGEFAIELARRHRLNLQQPLFFAAWIIRKFRRHLAESIPLFEQTYSLALEKGDFEYASYACNNRMQALFHLGRPLEALLPEMERAHRDLQRFQLGSSLYWHDIWWQTALNFEQPGPNPVRLAGVAYDEARSLPQHLSVNDASTLFLLHTAKLMLACFFGEWEAAWAQARSARSYLPGGLGTHAYVLFHVYESLALLLHRDAPDAQAVAQQVSENQDKLQVWAQHAPDNYQQLWLLVEAERLRMAGDSEAAMRRYDEAIDQARAGGFIHEEALAHELCGRCYLQRGQNRLASFYLRQALILFERWGAAAKTQRLGAEFADLLLTATPHAERATVTQGHSTGRSARQSHLQFDLKALTEAYQALSREIVFEDMVTSLLRIVIEHSGAQKAVLLLREGGRLELAAQGRFALNTQVEVARLPFDGEAAGRLLPRSLVQYVNRTAKSQVLQDARLPTIYSLDPYFVAVRPLSVLCEPIVHQGKPVGLLYLENNLTVGAFTEPRLELLRLLSSQAAISIENARLYADMEARVRERTRELARANAQLEQKSQELERISVTDPLTRLFNRRRLDACMDVEFERARRYDTEVALILIDIDHFKQVNDSHGHQIGDEVLCQVAATLQLGIRASDIAGRWGGEEFLILCPETDLLGAEAMAEKLRGLIQLAALPAGLHCTASLGVAQFQPGDDPKDLVSRADLALYRAKSAGRNRVEVAARA